MDEENELRYISGYAPFKLITKFRSASSERRMQFVICLQSMKEDESDTEKTFEGETSDWIRRIDKGGLFKVNDDTYSSLLLSGVLHGAEDVGKLWERFMLARRNADLGWLSLGQCLRTSGVSALERIRG